MKLTTRNPQESTRWLRAGLLCSALALSAGCNEVEAVRPVTVDVFLSTGPNRLEKGSAEPLQVAVNDVNAAGGINGQELQLWLHDVAPGRAVAEAVALKDTGVRVIFSGPSDLTIPLINNVTIPSKVFTFAFASSSVQLGEELSRATGGYFARTTYSCSGAAKKLARMVYDSGARRVGLIQAEDGIGPEYAAEFMQAFRDEGGEITGDPPAAQYIPSGAVQTTYKTELTEAVRDASLIDGRAAVVALVSADAFKVLLRDAQESNLKLAWFGAHTLREKGVLDESPTAAEGMRGIAPAHGRPDKLAVYSESFRKYFPDSDPESTWYPHAYDALVVYALSLARSGGGVPSAEKVKANLRKISNAGIGKKVLGPGQLQEAFETILAGGDVDYQGASGSMDFGGAGDVISNWIEYRVQDGRFIFEDDPDF
jgi:branched-chain amino acid transport system substrate-binding protein